MIRLIPNLPNICSMILPSIIMQIKRGKYTIWKGTANSLIKYQVLSCLQTIKDASSLSLLSGIMHREESLNWLYAHFRIRSLPCVLSCISSPYLIAPRNFRTLQIRTRWHYETLYKHQDYIRHLCGLTYWFNLLQLPSDSSTLEVSTYKPSNDVHWIRESGTRVKFAQQPWNN